MEDFGKAALAITGGVLLFICLFYLYNEKKIKPKKKSRITIESAIYRTEMGKLDIPTPIIEEHLNLILSQRGGLKLLISTNQRLIRANKKYAL